MVLSSDWMSLPKMYAVPDVGGNGPVRIDLKKRNIMVKNVKFTQHNGQECCTKGLAHHFAKRHLHGSGLSGSIVAQK